MKNKNSLIVCDRDGIINNIIYHSDTGNIDSPMSINEIKVFPWVPEILKQLCDLGFNIVIATNQPAAAKGKILYNILYNIHDYIINIAKSKGALILNSYICVHRSEDNCDCRKPKTGLLQKAFKDYPEYLIENSWMIGDRSTDILAGHNYGLQTALLGPSIPEDKIDEDLLIKNNIKPSYRGKDLRDFYDFIKMK